MIATDRQGLFHLLERSATSSCLQYLLREQKKHHLLVPATIDTSRTLVKSLDRFLLFLSLSPLVAYYFILYLYLYFIYHIICEITYTLAVDDNCHRSSGSVSPPRAKRDIVLPAGSPVGLHHLPIPATVPTSRTLVGGLNRFVLFLFLSQHARSPHSCRISRLVLTFYILHLSLFLLPTPLPLPSGYPFFVPLASLGQF